MPRSDVGWGGEGWGEGASLERHAVLEHAAWRATTPLASCAMVSWCSAAQPDDYYLQDDTVPILNVAFGGVLVAAMFTCWVIFFYRLYRCARGPVPDPCAAGTHLLVAANFWPPGSTQACCQAVRQCSAPHMVCAGPTSPTSGGATAGGAPPPSPARK